MQRIFPLVGSTESKIYRLYFEFAIGATGAVGTITRNRGISSIVRNSAGDYTLNLKDSWNALVGYNFDVIVSGPAATDGTWSLLKARTLGATSTPSVEFVCFTNNGTQTAADPKSGSIISGWLDVQSGRAV